MIANMGLPKERHMGDLMEKIEKIGNDQKQNPSVVFKIAVHCKDPKCVKGFNVKLLR